MSKVIYFIGSLRSGGKERRLIELLTYLNNKNGYELMVVLFRNQIDYPAFYDLNLKYFILNKKPNFKDPKMFIEVYKICKAFNPDIIHTWGNMQAFYSIPSSKILKIPLVNSQITSAKPKEKKFGFTSFIDWFNFRFSDVVLSNSKAGLRCFGLSEKNKKFKVIYNGFNPARLENLPSKNECRQKFGIKTKYTVIMVGSFSENKDYQKFLNVCECVCEKREDISFLAAGDGKYLNAIKCKAAEMNLKSIKFLGNITNVEWLINASDIGVLFSPNGEGISNSIMEYMALGKPVIANDSGGTNEIVVHNESGYLITDESNREIAKIITNLIDNPLLMQRFSSKGENIVKTMFSLEKMGEAFHKIYQTYDKSKVK